MQWRRGRRGRREAGPDEWNRRVSAGDERPSGGRYGRIGGFVEDEPVTERWFVEAAGAEAEETEDVGEDIKESEEG